MAIDRLSAGALSAGAQFPFYAPEQGQDRKASLTDLADAVEGLLGSPSSMPTQYLSPSSGFNVTISPAVQGGSVFLLLTPSTGLAAGTVTLPALSAAEDAQEVLCHSTNNISTFTVAGNGASVSGGPTAMTAGGFWRLRFDRINSTWYRVG